MPATDATTESNARQRLAAIRALFGRRDRLENAKKATSKKWADQLTEDTQALHGEIDQDPPKTKVAAIERLKEIRSLYNERKDHEDEKKAELKALDKGISATETAMREFVDAEPTDQLDLDLASDDGVAVGRDAARQLKAAFEEIEREGGELEPDMEELRDRLGDLTDSAPLSVVED